MEYSPMETNLVRLPAKFTGLPIQETPKQHKTPPKKKLLLEKNESDQKIQNVQETREEELDKELAKLVEAEKKELLKKVNGNKRAGGRMSTGKLDKTPLAKRARSSGGSSASFTSTKSITPPRDEDLPEFDPEKFTPGYVPKTVKKGDEEYVIVVSGVPDTGLCGKYWGDVTSLPSRRRKATPHPLTGSTKTSTKKSTPSVDVEQPATFISTPKTSAKSISSTMDVEMPPSLTSTPKSKKNLKNKALATSAPGGMTGTERKAEEIPVEEVPQLKMRTGRKQSQECSQLDIKAFLEWEPELESISKDKNGTEPEQIQDTTQRDSEKQKLISSQSKETVTHQYQEHTELETKGLEVKLSPALTDGFSSPNSENLKGEPENNTGSSSLDLETSTFTTEATTGQLKAMSCSSVNTQVGVMVNCYARRDDHRWVGMGKEAEGMALDAVQYAIALRPPYHLVSFLRIKGHSSKGISRTEKNTMVFVVMEGEVRVTIHTSQFCAKKGDSFYVAPMNSYNLINENANEAELSLIQFQYDGPLPSARQVQN